MMNFVSRLVIQKKPAAQSMYKVGITGGMGSGKSTVCKIFETLGVPVYYTDDRAKWLMSHDETLKNKIRHLFGDAAFLPDGSLNREYMASIAFQDTDMLAQLNQIVHPAVWLDSERWSESHINAPYTLRESAILFESGGHHLLDKIISVYAPKNIRLERLLKRDNSLPEAIEARMDRQMPDEEKIKLADFVIYNDGQHSLISQVMQVHRQLTEIANQSG